MSENNLLRWIEGYGWLVFAGGSGEHSELRARALARADADGATAYISLVGDSGDALMEDMEDLGAGAGYLVDIEHLPPHEIIAQLSDTSVVVIEIGNSVDEWLRVMNEAVIEGLRTAYENGAVILIEGLAMNVFGRWVISDSGDILPGLNWVQDVFLEPNVTSAAESRAVQDVLARDASAIAIEIGEGSALVLGTGKQVEIWGERQVTISLGRAYKE